MRQPDLENWHIRVCWGKEHEYSDENFLRFKLVSSGHLWISIWSSDLEHESVDEIQTLTSKCYYIWYLYIFSLVMPIFIILLVLLAPGKPQFTNSQDLRLFWLTGRPLKDFRSLSSSCIWHLYTLKDTISSDSVKRGKSVLVLYKYQTKTQKGVKKKILKECERVAGFWQKSVNIVYRIWNSELNWSLWKKLSVGSSGWTNFC